MADSTTMEYDFFQIEKQKGSPGPPPSKHVGSPHRRIQKVVSKINPLLLKTVMNAGGSTAHHARSVNGTSSWTTSNPPQSPSNPSTSPSAVTLLSPLPVLSPASRSAPQGHPETTPLTIFYNGMVAAFDVPRDKAEAIIRMAASGMVEDDPVEKPSEDPSLDDHQVGDLPIARSKSLQKFLDKRKDRVNEMAPPSCGHA